MATSTIVFSGQLTQNSLGELFCDLTYKPTSNISGKLCYVKGVAFNFSPTYSNKLGWHTYQLYVDGWPTVQTAKVDWNPSVAHGGQFTYASTLGSNVLSSAVAYGIPVGATIVGTGIPSGSTVTATSVSAGTVTISSNVTSTNTSTTATWRAPSRNQAQTVQVPLVSYNDYALHQYTTLCQIPDGPHTLRFRVRRSDNNFIVNSSTAFGNFSVTFSVVAANSRQAP